MTTRELAKKAAGWINRTPLGVYPMVRCHRSSVINFWWVTTYQSLYSKWDGFRTDTELIDQAKTMGWMPDETPDEPARTTMFPPVEETEQ